MLRLRQWILRTKGIFLLTVVVTGCSSPLKPQRVAVDLNVASKGDVSHFSLRVSEPVAESAPEIAVKDSIPGKASEVVHLTDDLERKKQVETSIRLAREGAKKRLQRRLENAYLAELNKTIPDLESDLNTLYRSEHDRILLESDGPFQSYAERRGRLWARYILVLTTPDRRDRRYQSAGFIEPREATAQELKAQLDKMDEEYREVVRTEIGKVDRAHRQRLAELRESIEKQRTEIIASAEAEASKQVETELVQLNQFLDAAEPITLPATPAAGSNKSLKVQTATSQLPAGKLLDPTALARHDATIWGKVSGYDVVFDGTAPDRTKEFMQWRRQKLGH